MKLFSYGVSLFLVAYGISSCRTLNTMQTRVVKKFSVTAKEVSDMPYKIMYNYYTIKFKRKQLIPENYVTGDTGKEELDKLAEDVISTIEVIRQDYYTDLATASEIRIIYELLETYISSLEKLSAGRYAQDFEKRSYEMGHKMNGLVSKLNASPRTKTNLSLNPGAWLSSMATMYGRMKIKSMQYRMLKDYINQSDTLVQAINRNYQEIQVPIMKVWFKEEQESIRDQFKRSIAPYLHYFSRYPDSTTTIVAIEFYSKINPVYYDLTDEIHKNQLLIQQTALLMNDLARTHNSLKEMFMKGSSWLNVAEQVDGLKENLFVLNELFNKEGQQKFLFYKNFIMQNEKNIQGAFDKR